MRHALGWVTLLAAIAVAMPVDASTAIVTRLFSVPPASDSLPPPRLFPRYAGARVEYPVRVAWRSLAHAALSEGGASLVIELPGRAPIEVQQRQFDPVGGFELDDSGDLVLATDTIDREVSFYWFGIADRTEVTITVHRGNVVGRIAPDASVWTLVESENFQLLRDIALDRYPALSEGPFVDAPPKARRSRRDPKRRERTSKITDVVDVLVVYTSRAVTEAGSVANLESLIATSISNLNQALRNSNVVSVVVRNALGDGSGQGLPINFPNATDFSNSEDNGFTTLDPMSPTSIAQHFSFHKRWLREQPQIASWRNQYAADVVILMTGRGGDIDGDSRIDVCGNAYVQRPNCAQGTFEVGCGVGSAFEPFAYGAVSAVCAVERYELAHELSHLFGMEHHLGNQASAVGQGSHPWSYAYRRSNLADPLLPGHRTITAYACPGASANDPTDYCPVKLHFSNPFVDFLDAPGYKTGRPQADPVSGYWTFNARTASLSAPAVSDFRGGTVLRIFRGDFEDLPDLPP